MAKLKFYITYSDKINRIRKIMTISASNKADALDKAFLRMKKQNQPDWNYANNYKVSHYIDDRGNIFFFSGGF